MDPPIDTVSECWRAESETVIDTTSEPPALYGRQADRIRSREPGDAEAAAARRRGRDAPTQLSAKLEGYRSGAAGIGSNGNWNKNSAAAPASVKSSRSGKKSSSASAAMSSSGRSRRSRKSSAASAKSSAGRSVRGDSAKSGKGDGESSLCSRTGSRRKPQGSSDAPEGGGGVEGNNHLALVPMPRRDVVGVDPPENDSVSTSGSNSSQDECTAVLYDPPSAADNSLARDEEQLAVWEGDEYDEESESERSSFEDEATYPSRLSRIGESGSEEEEESDDDGDGSYGEEDGSYFSEDGSATRGSELASAVERALAIREQGEDDGLSSYGGSRALVARDGGVDSHYEGELVPREEGAMGRYLAGAVDNNHAMVPVDSAIYEAYDHTFVTCPEMMRFRFLYTFLKKNLDKKVMIFFSTTNSAKYHASLLGRFNIKVSTMHSRQKRDRFIRTFLKFSDLDEGILCATDTAGRELDIPPSVDWVIQFEPPEDPSEFILRVARISCDSDRVGRSLLFLNPGEQGFLKYYHSASIPVSEFEIPPNLADVQSTVERHVSGSERLGRAARDAYGSYLIAYASHGFRDVYNVHDLDKSNVASAFGLVGLPSNADDDVTEDTETLVSGGESRVGGEPAAYYASSRPSSSSRGGSSSGGGGGRQQWEKQERARNKSWMKGEKSWPHSQIKLHPRFKGEKF